MNRDNLIIHTSIHIIYHIYLYTHTHIHALMSILKFIEIESIVEVSSGLSVVTPAVQGQK